MQKKLRAHHLLCIPLYEGEGYSEKFNRNMSEMIELLHEPKTKAEIVREPDMICSECPNLLESGRCNSDRNEVAGKDLFLITALNLPTKVSLPYEQLQRLLKKNLTREIFDTACKGCRWRKAGLCSYEKLKLKLI